MKKNIVIDDKGIKALICDMYEMNEELRRVRKKYDKQKREFEAIIEDYLDKKGIPEVCVDYNGNTAEAARLKVVRVMSKKIEYKIDRLERKIDRKVIDKFVERSYKIKDWKSVVRLLKKYNVPAKEFISLVEVNKTVNESKLEQLEATGEINYDMIDGCFVVNFLKSYIRIFCSKRKEKS